MNTLFGITGLICFLVAFGAAVAIFFGATINRFSLLGMCLAAFIFPFLAAAFNATVN